MCSHVDGIGCLCCWIRHCVNRGDRGIDYLRENEDEGGGLSGCSLIESPSLSMSEYLYLFDCESLRRKSSKCLILPNKQGGKSEHAGSGSCERGNFEYTQFSQFRPVSSIALSGDV